MKKIKNLAFTLAEVISVLVILGVVAAITIPTATKKITERQNRTKVAKAIAAYEKLISKFTIENQLSVNTSTLNKMARYNSMTLPASVAKLSEYTQGMAIGSDEYNAALNQRRNDLQVYNSEIDSGECENIRKYFKISKFYDGNLENNYGRCIFKSGDIWWNTYNIANTIIAFKPEILLDSNIHSIASDYEDNRAFYLTLTKDSNGSYRTNYTSSTTTSVNKEKILKANDFAFNKETIAYLTCTDNRKTSCTKYRDWYTEKSLHRYQFVDVSDSGNYETYYEGCSGTDRASCKCVYEKDKNNRSTGTQYWTLKNPEDCVSYVENNELKGTVCEKFYTSSPSVSPTSGLSRTCKGRQLYNQY